ncbi:hypothetical protein [Bifidobacterium sp. ESL0745]|uniref:hypothetical protein n=1 Tax=Bifidobacterium sp. ESL0745 TaxID=2983226 RepID=UPI0023F72F27|nr:hypothetical protein [Bifidobacterium sp. ESL0745]MDF7666186.1 hypothetical protein [Bifidobacterium sp. ESL0745]
MQAPWLLASSSKAYLPDFIVQADSVIVDIVLVAIGGYLVMMDFRDGISDW